MVFVKDKLSFSHWVKDDLSNIATWKGGPMYELGIIHVVHNFNLTVGVAWIFDLAVSLVFPNKQGVDVGNEMFKLFVQLNFTRMIL